MSVVSKFEVLVKAAKEKGYQLDEANVRLKEDDPLLGSGFAFSLPDEVRDFFVHFGGKHFSGTTCSFQHLVPWCEVCPLEFSVVYATHLGSDLRSARHRKYFVKTVVVPFMWNGNDYISFCQTHAGRIGITYKRMGHGTASEIWQSAELFFEYHTKCWREGIYWYREPDGELEYDAERLGELQLESEKSGACVSVSD